MRPVPIGRDQDVPGRRHAGATVPSRVMPAPVRIGVLIAIPALVAPVAAAGLLLLLGGVALRRRPHGER